VLVDSMTDLNGPCSGKVQSECLRLICRIQLWVTAEEKIICLMDQGQEALNDALYENMLIWQIE